MPLATPHRVIADLKGSFKFKSTRAYTAHANTVGLVLSSCCHNVLYGSQLWRD